MSEYLNLLALQKQNMDTANPMRNFMAGAQDYNTIMRQQMDNKAAQMRMDQDALENPMRLDALRQSLDTGRLNQQVAQRGLDADQQASTIKSLKMAADMSRNFAAAGDIDGLRSLVPKMQEMLPPEVSSRFAELAELGDIDSIKQGIQAIDAIAVDPSLKTANRQNFDYLTSIIAPAVKDGKFDPSIATPTQLAAAMELNIIEKSGTKTQDIKLAENPDLARRVEDIKAGQSGATAGASETAKLDVQGEKLPKIDADRERARLKVQAEVEKQIAQQGQLGRFQDAQALYTDLMPGGKEDLSRLNRIYGRGESLYPKIARSQEGINSLAQRDQLVSMLQLGARGELKGQGPITESEQGILSKAITILAEPDISPKLASQYINQAMDILGRNAGKAPTTPKANDIDDLVNQYAD